jgi:hypothetical protein
LSYELFLEWLSERGSGRWSLFVAAHDWLFNAGRSQSEGIKATWTARTLSDLGHIEIDWQAQRWSVTPSILTVLPTAGARSLLTGGRTRTLMRRLDEETSESVTDNIVFARHHQDEGPDAIFLVSRDETDVENLASRLGIYYDYSAADSLSIALPSLDSYLAVSEATPAPTGYEVQRFDATSLRWATASGDVAPGLYAYEVYGPARQRFITQAGVSHEVERAIGIYAELRRTSTQVLNWTSEDINGALIVPGQASLPTLHARVATACSGLAATFSKATSARRYVNVPLITAERIAASLGQTLELGRVGQRAAAHA